MKYDKLIDDVINIINTVKKNKDIYVLERTSLLSDVDMDSLEIFELCEIIKERYGVDILSSQEGLSMLVSPREIALGILKYTEERQS